MLCLFSMGLQFSDGHADQHVLVDGHSGSAVHEVKHVQTHPHVHGGAGGRHASGKWSAGSYSRGKFHMLYI